MSGFAIITTTKKQLYSDHIATFSEVVASGSCSITIKLLVLCMGVVFGFCLLFKLNATTVFLHMRSKPRQKVRIFV